MDAIECFRETLKELIGDHNIEQYSRAVGIKRQNIDYWVKGLHLPTVKGLVKISDYHGCSMDYLFGLADIRDFEKGSGEATFPERYSMLVKLNNLTDYKVAKMCEIGNAAIAKWRNKGQIPGIPTLLKLTEILGCSLDFLLGRTDRI